MSDKITRRKFLENSLKCSGYVYGSSIVSVKVLSKISRVRNRNEFDIIIRNGEVINGTGGKGIRVDIGIIDDKIAAIGNLSEKTSKQIIDAAGLIVSPGFIDIHTHTGTDLLVNSRAESKIRQGVTTEIGGQCGSSPGPWNEESFKKVKKNYFEEYELEIDWKDLDGFFSRLEKSGTSVNLAMMVGHGTIRDYAMGMNDRHPSTAELEKMKALLTEAVEQGACGLSTGLEYTPGSFAATEEIIQLAKVLNKFGLPYATHIRNEDDRVLEAIEEALEIGKKAEVPVQISHLKAIGKRNYHKIDKILEHIEKASGEGLPVNFDRYPYIAYSTGLSILFPLWSREGGDEEFVKRITDNSLKKRIKEEVLNKVHLLGDWNKVMICSAFNEKDNLLAGKRIGDAASETGMDPYDFSVELLERNENRVSIVGFGMDEEGTKKILSHPLAMVGSDGAIAAPYGKLSKGKPHPRYYGTFPRAIGHYCRKEKIFNLPEVIRKITSMPAEKAGLKNRGKIKESYCADITIFDYQTIIDTATFVEPHNYPEGIKYVLVNGKIVIKNGDHTGKFPGKILKFRT